MPSREREMGGDLSIGRAAPERQNSGDPLAEASTITGYNAY